MIGRYVVYGVGVSGLCALLCGCITYQAPSKPYDRHDQDVARRAHLLDARDGATRREDVLRILGQPGARSTDHRVLVYRWNVDATRYTISLTGDRVKQPDLGRRHAVFIFDDQGLLRQHFKV